MFVESNLEGGYQPPFQIYIFKPVVLGSHTHNGCGGPQLYVNLFEAKHTIHWELGTCTRSMYLAQWHTNITTKSIKINKINSNIGWLHPLTTNRPFVSAMPMVLSACIIYLLTLLITLCHEFLHCHKSAQ